MRTMLLPARCWPAVGRRGTLTYMSLPQDGVDHAETKVGPAKTGKLVPGPRTKVLSNSGALMKIAPWYLAALAPFAAVGYSGSHLGHALVVVLTVGIFLGTLSLGKRRVATVPDSRE